MSTETEEETPPEDPPAPDQGTGKTIADENAEPPEDLDEDLSIDPVPPERTEIDPKAQVSAEKFTIFMTKAKHKKIKVTRLVKMAKDNGLTEISMMRNEQYDGMMSALGLIS